MNPTPQILLVLCTACLCGCGNNQVDQLIQDLSSNDDAIRRSSIAKLAKIEEFPPPVFLAIQSATQDQDREVRRIAYTALGSMPDSDQSVRLETGLQDPELSVRMAVAYSLLKQNPEHPGAILVLEQAMKMGDGGVIVAIGREKYDWAVPTLIDLLRDRRPGTRRLAAESLGKIGQAAKPALSALKRAKKDRDDRVRAAAIAAESAIQNALD